MFAKVGVKPPYTIPSYNRIVNVTAFPLYPWPYLMINTNELFVFYEKQENVWSSSLIPSSSNTSIT